MASPQLTTISPSINPSKPVNHYKAYKPRPFKKEERDKVTILYGGLTWKHERLIQGALHNLNYKAEPSAQHHARRSGRWKGIDRRRRVLSHDFYHRQFSESS